MKCDACVGVSTMYAAALLKSEMKTGKRKRLSETSYLEVMETTVGTSLNSLIGEGKGIRERAASLFRALLSRFDRAIMTSQHSSEAHALHLDCRLEIHYRLSRSALLDLKNPPQKATE